MKLVKHIWKKDLYSLHYWI